MSDAARTSHAAAGAGDRGRAADAAFPAPGARGATATADRRGHDRRRTVSRRPPRARRTWCCSTWGSPTSTGSTVTARLREWSQVPIVVISARGREDGQGRGARRGRRRLRDQAVRRARAARAAAAWRCGARARAGGGRVVARSRSETSTIDLEKRRVTERGERRAPHADRVPAARRAGAQRRQGAHPLAPAATGVGPGLRAAEPLPARLHDAAPAASSRKIRRGPRILLTEAGRRLPVARAPTHQRSIRRMGP